MTQSHRIANAGRINRQKKVKFSFDGQSYDGFEGDTLASALMANGVHLVARSFKYHRPRGIYTCGVEEPNALMQLHEGAATEPNSRATMTEITAGLKARSQNAWPSLKHDFMSVNGLFSKFLTAGFYYKTFMWPGSWWMFYERFIRKAAGMGEGTYLTDESTYEKSHIHCDVLVVGAGPAGLSAALEASKKGSKVLLLEQDYELGGRLLSEEDKDGHLTTLVETVKAADNIRVLNRTTAYGYFDHNVVEAVERVSDHLDEKSHNTPRQRKWTIRAKSVVLATGAVERPFVFGNNDLPGIMLASGAQTYMRRYGVKPGQAAVLFTNNDSSYEVIDDLIAAGVKVKAIVDSRKTPPTAVIDKAKAHGVFVRAGWVVTDAIGKLHLKSVEINEYDAVANTASQHSEIIDCDLLLQSSGWSPILHLQSHTGIKPTYSDELAAFMPSDCPEGQYCAGGILGHWNAKDAMESGRQIGEAAAAGTKQTELSLKQPTNALNLEALWEVPSPEGKKLKKFVDLQHDVTASDVVQAHQEGYVSVEHLKRYTTLGMATDQGKTSNINGMAIMARERNLPLPKVGTTTFRPPYTPVALGAIVGRETGMHFRAERLTPMHDLHIEAGAELTQTGAWQRAWYYPKAGESIRDAYIREAAAVRGSLGMTDISTLGKIDVQGPDAAEFLNRVYTNGWKKLAVGKARYGLMLREDGYVMDDGTTSRLSDDHFFMTTTSAGAAKVLAHLEYLLETCWPDLKVIVTSSTEQWAGMAVAGPNSRKFLQGLETDIDFSGEALPPMGVVTGKINDIPVRVNRISFSGELAFEVYTPAGYGAALWSHLRETGQAYDLTIYGTEALGALRIEKGHVAGPELDGRTTLGDMGLGKMASTKKAFVGSVLSQRAGMTEASRPKLVGLKPVNTSEQIVAGSILFNEGEKCEGHGRGHVSSTTYSPVFKHNIALGFLEDGEAKIGSTIVVSNPTGNQEIRALVVSPHFFDPKGERQNA